MTQIFHRKFGNSLDLILSSIVVRTIIVGLFALGFTAQSLSSEITKEVATTEKQVTFYTTYGYEKDGVWVVPMRIWVHEKPDAVRRLALKVARKAIAKSAGIEEPDEFQKKLFISRAEDFIADSESKEEVVFKFDLDPEDKEYRVKGKDGKFETDRNGIIEGSITLSTESAQKLLKAQESEHGWLTYRAVSDKHGGAGLLRLLPFTGLSVISDIDDTIKITDIPAGESVVLMNTFFRNFVAVPCMADIYRTFGKEVAFHYVSGAPWQMYSPLSMFLFSKSIGFPRGSFHMKNVRTNPFESETYQDLWILIASGSQESTFAQKIFQINILMKNFPARKFILIGDSGERDPEVFRKINENFPGQVQEIRIRDVVNDKEKKPSRLDGMTLISPNIDLNSLCNEPVNTE